MYSKVKKGLHNPRKALQYLCACVRQIFLFKHLSQKEYEFLKLEKMEQAVKPTTPLEACMVQPTDIHEHLQTLHMLSVELDLKTVLELGTRGGESTIALLEAAKKKGGIVYSIDIDPCLEAKAKIHAYRLDKYWVFIQGDDLKVEWNRAIDHLFIDTMHTYISTIKELEKFEPYVKNGGIIVLHDIVSHPEVLLAINDYARNRKDLRIYKYFNCQGLAIIFKGHMAIRHV